MQPYSPQDRLSILYRLSQTFNSSLDLDEVLNRVMDEVIAAMRAERGFVMLHDANGELAFHVARGIEQTTIEAPQFQVSQSVVKKAARSGMPILTADAQVDERFSMRQSVMIQGLRSILCVPLMMKDKVTGVIYVDNRMQAGMFTQADLELLASIASTAAIAIENARLYQEAVEKGRLERELQVAREVQASLLPQEMPYLPGWEFAALWKPARQVAGDYYDFIPVWGGKLGLVIADVTDKGMPAALFMASTRSIARASLDRAASPDEGIIHVNQLICAETVHDMFVTLFYALLDENDEIIYVNAGHNPPLRYNARQDTLTLLTRTGMALGVEIDALYDQRSEILKRGDFIFLYTDGVTDAINSGGQEYGMQRLREVIWQQRGSPVKQMVAALEHSVQAFTETDSLYDDITILAARRL